VNSEAVSGNPDAPPATFELPDGGDPVAIDRPKLTIGSALDSDVRLGASWIAPLHARLDTVAGAHHIVAEGTAQILLGGEPITSSVLHDGDVIRFPDPTTHGLVTIVYRSRSGSPRSSTSRRRPASGCSRSAASMPTSGSISRWSRASTPSCAGSRITTRCTTSARRAARSSTASRSTAAAAGSCRMTSSRSARSG
jgi:hypothetical protein